MRRKETQTMEFNIYMEAKKKVDELGGLFENGINWAWVYFDTATIAEEFMAWCREHHVRHSDHMAENYGTVYSLRFHKFD
jgi:hypothetical protein